MKSWRTTKILKWGALFTGGLLVLSASAYFDREPIAIQSLESRTNEGEPVFNRIRWISQGNQDIWMMQQSHHGAALPPEKRDRLAIVVDKSVSPKTARFYQLEPGALEWTPQAKQVGYRASCFLCHTNGPRAIRPDGDSSAAPLSLWQWGKVAAWNLRIKTYGRVVAHPESGPKDPTPAEVMSGEVVPFRYLGVFENQVLRAKTCVRCHNEKFWGRGSLTRQNGSTIHFMVKSGFMPPRGFSLSDEERAEIYAFIGLPAEGTRERAEEPPGERPEKRLEESL